MPKRLLYVLGALLLIATVVVVVWQGSFAGNFFIPPDDPTQTFVFYALSTLIFLLMLTLGFLLVRIVVKLWIERQHNRVGSRIRSKLVFGALALSAMPVFFMVLFSYYVLNATLQKWFNRPEEHELVSFNKMSGALKGETLDTAQAEAELLAAMPEARAALASGSRANTWFDQFCRTHHIQAATITPAGPLNPVAAFGKFPDPASPMALSAQAPIRGPDQKTLGTVRVAVAVPVDVAAQEQAINGYDREFAQLGAQRKRIRSTETMLLFLIALFILFIATWLAYFLARQISAPIAAALQAVEEVRKGHLEHRINVGAMDELAELVSGFNRMTGDLEANRAELESRRRFTEAILESIPTGVISVDSSGQIQRVNKALEAIFPPAQLRNARRLDELFSREDATEIRYLMNRALRTGQAARQFEIRTPASTVHLAITVAAIISSGSSSSGGAGRRSSGFVIVIEDTSDLLRAQKAAAWSEVARRVAHEIKNPLTPIALSAERILRMMTRLKSIAAPGAERNNTEVVRECAAIILEETASVKRLVDEFSQFSRLPAAQPVVCDLNTVVNAGLSVFEGRLEGIDVQVDLGAGLAPVLIDTEQFKRVVVNLIDNAAEAMEESPAKFLLVQTRAGDADTVVLIVADSGCGVTADQKEKLFLPYFSTKGRGTGLGLAIVSHILTEHNATVRVEDNKPSGAVFTVEIAAVSAEAVSEMPAGTTVVGA